MSWTVVFKDSQAAETSAVLPDPEYGDSHAPTRRQRTLESDGGTIFTQDLGVEDEFRSYTWLNIEPDIWGDLLRVFRAALWRANPLRIDVDGGISAAANPFPVGISPGQEICGVGVSPGQGFSPGDFIPATKFTLAVFLEQSEAELIQLKRARGSVTLRFRIDRS